MKLRKKGFTLIEMLIVIVIIGILASALIPRLNNMQARARDAARKADLNQLGTAITAYFTDFGQYPGTGAHDINEFAAKLAPSYLSSIPSDPLQTRVVDGIGGTAWSPGQYRFTTIKKGGFADGWFIIMAATETYWASSNYVVTASSWTITSQSEFNGLNLCQNINNIDPFGTNWNPCTTTSASDLRYIYKN